MVRRRMFAVPLPSRFDRKLLLMHTLRGTVCGHTRFIPHYRLQSVMALSCYFQSTLPTAKQKGLGVILDMRHNKLKQDNMQGLYSFY